MGEYVLGLLLTQWADPLEPALALTVQKPPS